MENNGKTQVDGQEATGFAALSDVSADSIFDDLTKNVIEDKPNDDKGNITDDQEIKDFEIPDDKKDGNDKSKGDGGDDQSKGKGEDDSNPKPNDEKGGEKDNEFKLPGEENDDDSGNDGGNASTDNWVDLGKELGFEVKEDSFDVFKKSYEEFKENEKKELEKSIVSKKKDDLLLAYDAEAQLIIKGLDAGLTLEQIQKPFAKIDQYLSMGDADLIAEDLRLQGWPEDKIEKKILDLTETEKLELHAFEIRKSLEDSKKEISLSREKELSDIKAQQEQKMKDTLNKEAEEIHSQLKTVQSFMESPIKEKHINYVMNKWKNGEYHEDFKDPKVIADFLLYKEFGAQGIKNLANKKLQEGRSAVVKKLHNIPPITSGNQGSNTKSNNNESSIGNFAIFEGLSEEQV